MYNHHKTGKLRNERFPESHKPTQTIKKSAMIREDPWMLLRFTFHVSFFIFIALTLSALRRWTKRHRQNRRTGHR